ncbi:MAG TPA: M48 family metalloprotease [Candidatus Angelobacter sp.]|jgi:tetratricopeptide (TPR) repeat protein|nr:M48 family metalloprotease [Candidatus Angelobacter sp.]
MKLRHLLVTALVLVLGIPSYAQFGLGGRKDKDKEKNKEASVAAESDAPPEFSAKDKEKMEELAQKPDIKEAIDREWEDARREDMEVAYAVNTRTRDRLLIPSSGDSHSSDYETLQRVAKFGTLYENPILQDYVNNLGQSLVPPDSPNLYVFRLTLNPVPRAESLTTGTIYVSTGLVSMLDNEAQLAYVLGHEVAHIEKMHRFQKIRNSILEKSLIAEKEKDAQHKRAIFGAIMAGAGAAIGGGLGGWSGAGLGALGGGFGGYELSRFIFRQRLRPTDWSAIDENEADEIGLKLALTHNYDVREVPKTYARLDTLVGKDERVGLGFIGSKKRVKERMAHIQGLLSGAMKADLETKKNAGLTGSSANFSLLMAALKRDNGIVAMDYDMFPMAKDNLEDAVSIRSNDPRAFYYLGKVTALTGRSAEEKQKAVSHFLKAIQYDAERGSYPEPHLQYALSLIRENNPSANHDKILEELKSYVNLYQRQNGGQLPANMPIIYDYFLLAGENSWFVPPVANVSTKNVEAIRVVTQTQSAAQSASQTSHNQK